MKNFTSKDKEKCQLLLRLYDGMVNFCGMAKTAFEKDDMLIYDSCITKINNIIIELTHSINYKDKEHNEFIINLSKLYCYINDLLKVARDNRDISKVDQVLSLIMPLRDEWKEAVEQIG